MFPEVGQKRKRVLSVFSLVMINIIAVDSLRSLPFNAQYGYSLVFYYILCAVFFFIPVALVAAECATGWPATGGIYVWVREAFGRRWGFFTIWLQWVYNIVWYPTILAFLSATLAYLIDPALANNRFYLWTSVMILFWIGTIVNFFGMRISSWVSTIGAILGTLLPMIIIIALGIAWLVQGKPIQIQFDFKSFWPDFSNTGNLAFITVVLFGLVGVEMSAVHAEDVKNPQRDYPKALLISTIVIFFSLVLSSLAIALVIPKSQLSLVSGLIDAFAIFFKAYQMPWMIPVIVVAILMGGFSMVAAWIIGPTKGLLIAAKDHELPKMFSMVNRFGAPVPVLLLQGLIFSVLSTAFILLPSVNASYWLLSDLTAQLALMVYVMMFAAAIVLRVKHPNVKRAFRVPGGMFGMVLISGLGILTCLLGISLGFLLPEKAYFSSVWAYDGFLAVGIILLSLPPFILHWWHPGYSKTPSQ